MNPISQAKQDRIEADKGDTLWGKTTVARHCGFLHDVWSKVVTAWPDKPGLVSLSNWSWRTGQFSPTPSTDAIGWILAQLPATDFMFKLIRCISFRCWFMVSTIGLSLGPPAGMGLECVRRLTGCVVRRLGPPPPARRECLDAKIKGPPGLSKLVVGQNIALDDVQGVYTYLVSAFPAHLLSFSPNFSKPSTVECILSNESEFCLW